MTDRQPHAASILSTRTKAAHAADWLAVLLAASIPISTSATSILVVFWGVALLISLNIECLREEILRARSFLPLLFIVLGACGMLWADVSWRERVHGIDSFFKFMAIPFLIVQFRRSSHGHWVMLAFLLACVVALLASAFFVFNPSLYHRDGWIYPVPFKNQATQSGEFVICIGILAYFAIDFWRTRKRLFAVATCLLCAGFLWMIAYSATGRTALVVAPVILVLLAFRQFHWRSAIAFLVLAASVVGALFASSDYLRLRTEAVWDEVHNYTSKGELTSAGERLVFWKKSVAIIARAPVLGHGTGTITDQMAKEAVGQVGPYATATTNPHQQTLAVAIQLGALGTVILWMMWIAHLLLFREADWTSWIGLVIVAQNIVGSLFNSHLFDFTQGWIYVVGVGVTAGMVDRAKGNAA